jgi:nitrite reductase/ring-hydroxylating ferredoxin subunit
VTESQYVRAAKVADLQPGSVLRVEVAGRAIALYNLDGAFYATDEICTHAYASLAEGFVDGETIECPLHGATFSIKTGEALSAPATEALATYAVRVDGDELLVAVPAVPSAQSKE